MFSLFETGHISAHHQTDIPLGGHCEAVQTSDQLGVGEIDQHEITTKPGFNIYLVNFSYGGWDDNYPKVGWNPNDPLLIVLG